MKKYLVLYMAPAAGMEEWMKLDEEVRKGQEEEMMAAWNSWMEKHEGMFTDIHAGAGKTKRVTGDSIADIKNDVMLFSIVQSDSHEAVAEVFADHPHFGIPGAWIDIMPVNPITM